MSNLITADRFQILEIPYAFYKGILGSKFRSQVSTIISNSLEIQKIENLDLVCSLELAILESCCKPDFVEMRENGIEILLEHQIDVQLDPATYEEGVRIFEALQKEGKRSKFIKKDGLYETACCVDKNEISWNLNFKEVSNQT